MPRTPSLVSIYTVQTGRSNMNCRISLWNLLITACWISGMMNTEHKVNRMLIWWLGNYSKQNRKMRLCCNSNFLYSLRAVANPVSLIQLDLFSSRVQEDWSHSLWKRMVNSFFPLCFMTVLILLNMDTSLAQICEEMSFALVSTENHFAKSEASLFRRQFSMQASINIKLCAPSFLRAPLLLLVYDCPHFVV